MTEQQQPDYAAIARAAFPVYSVQGSGPFAIRFRCARVMRLFEKFSDAATARDTMPCSAGRNGCTFQHDYVDLRRIQTEPAPRWVRKPHWAKEIARDEAAV